MDKETLSNYGWIVVCVLVLATLMALASPFGNFVAGAIKSTAIGLFNVNDAALEGVNVNVEDVNFGSASDESGDTSVPTGPVITNYTAEEIAADEHLYAIGLTKPEYVVAKFNDDYTELVITKNGDDSNGQMQDFAVWSPNMPSPMTQHKDTLTTVTVKEGIVNFGAGGGGSAPFTGCSLVTKITLPSTMTKVGGSAFTNIANGSVIDCTTPQVVITLMKTANSYNASTTTLIPELPKDDSLTLEEINANEYMHAIGRTKPEFVIAEFNEDYTSLRIYPNGMLSDGAIKNSDGSFLTENMSTVTEIIIEEGVTTLGTVKYGTHFLGASSITSITLPKSITTINGFGGCKTLTSVEIKADKVSISDSAFNGCTKLSSIDFSKMISIGDYAFSYCSSIKTVNIPSSFTRIGSAFQNMYSGDVKIYLGKNIKSVGSFTQLGPGSTIYCETKEIVDLFTSSKYTSSMTKIVGPSETESGTTTVTPTTNYTTSEIKANDHLYAIGATKPEYVVAKFNSDYTQVTISANGTGTDGKMTNWHPSIGKSPMQNYASKLKTAIIEEGVINIGDGSATYTAFYGCTNLSSVSLPSTLNKIGASAFGNCSSLRTLSIPNSVHTIGSSAFDNSGITSIKLPENVQELSTGVFARCYNLTSITLSSRTTAIYCRAFFQCSSLKEICLPKTITYIETNAFDSLSNKTTIYCETDAVLTRLKSSLQENCNANMCTDASKF